MCLFTGCSHGHTETTGHRGHDVCRHNSTAVLWSIGVTGRPDKHRAPVVSQEQTNRSFPTLDVSTKTRLKSKLISCIEHVDRSPYGANNKLAGAGDEA